MVTKFFEMLYSLRFLVRLGSQVSRSSPEKASEIVL